MIIKCYKKSTVIIIAWVDCYWEFWWIHQSIHAAQTQSLHSKLSIIEEREPAGRKWPAGRLFFRYLW